MRNAHQGERMSLKFNTLMTAALIALVGSFAAAQTTGQPERFTANAMSVTGEVRGGAQTVQITVNRWTPDAERQSLVATLLGKDGPKELLKQLQKQKSVGNIRTPDSIGYDLRYAHQEPAPDGGRTIVIATDRPIGFWEATNQPRTFDYRFTVIQMNIGRDGEGSGTMSYATKIVAKGNTIELENFASQPIMLNNIKAEPKK
jgi:hypothetical protein